jgi:hypothetical protein
MKRSNEAKKKALLTSNTSDAISQVQPLPVLCCITSQPAGASSNSTQLRAQEWPYRDDETQLEVSLPAIAWIRFLHLVTAL